MESLVSFLYLAMRDQIFSYGYPRGCEQTLPEISDYTCGKNLQAYYIDREFNANIDENEYTYFEVESYEPFIFGDQITFHDIPFYVGEVIK